MLLNKKLFLFSQIIFILNYLSFYSSIISIPFNLDILSIYKSHNSTSFYNMYCNGNIFLELNIGTPSKKAKATMNLVSSCFYLLNDSSNINNYYPINSSSFNLNDKSTRFYNLRNANDIIYFQNINKSQQLSFLLEDNTVEKIMNNNYIPKIGLEYPIYTSGKKSHYPCPNFLYELKQAKFINKMIWTIKFNSKYNGEFIIGGDLSEYDEEKYPNELYKTIYYDLQFSIIFDSICTIHKISNKIMHISDNKSSNDFRKAIININSGVIIGSSEYKNFIDNNFFNNLIKKKICKVDYVNDYLIYSCNAEFIALANPSIQLLTIIVNFLILYLSHQNWNIILY